MKQLISSGTVGTGDMLSGIFITNQRFTADTKTRRVVPSHKQWSRRKLCCVSNEVTTRHADNFSPQGFSVEAKSAHKTTG